MNRGVRLQPARPCWPLAIWASSGSGMTVQGWLYDVKNVTSPQVLGKQYQDAATTDAARIHSAQICRRDHLSALGGGIAGIAESKIFFVSTRSGHKEVWAMDYDGANQHAVTHLNSISLSPRVSPDGSRIAFSSMTKGGWDILMYSLDLNRLVTFPRFGGTNLSPAWSSDGTKLAFSSSRSGDAEIYVVGFLGSEPEADHVVQRPGCVAGVESQDRRTDRLGKWTHRTAPGLHHGIRRHQRAAARPIRATRSLPHGLPTGNFWWCPGCASTDQGRRERRIFTSWTSPASSGCN